METSPSREDKARISEQIKRVLDELPSHLRNVLRAARAGGAAAGGAAAGGAAAGGAAAGGAGVGGAGSLATLYFSGLCGTDFIPSSGGCGFLDAQTGW